MRWLSTVATVLVLSLGAAACGDDRPSGPRLDQPVAVAEVVEDVAYYYACGDEVLVLPDGRRFWPWEDQQAVDQTRYLDAPTGAIAFVGRVAPPRPGDDIGTLFVYADGMAKFTSRLGTVAWLDQVERTYPWVC